MVQTSRSNIDKISSWSTSWDWEWLLATDIKHWIFPSHTSRLSSTQKHFPVVELACLCIKEYASIVWGYLITFYKRTMVANTMEGDDTFDGFAGAIFYRSQIHYTCYSSSLLVIKLLGLPQWCLLHQETSLWKMKGTS